MQRATKIGLTRLVLLGLLLYTGWILFLYFKQEALIYPGAYFSGRARPAAAPPGIESLWVETTPGVRVEAWYRAGHGRSADNPGPAMILTHGNAEWIDDTRYFIEQYTQRGISVLSAEYRGYGRSGGSPTQAGIIADMIAFYDLLVARPEVQRDRVFYHGHSIGGGVVAQLAAARRPAALLLQSTFTDLQSFTTRYLAPAALCKHPWQTNRVLGSLQAPILILHGRHDTLIPVSHARALHALAPGSRLVELDGGHNDFPRDLDAYWSAIDAFLNQHGLGRGPGK